MRQPSPCPKCQGRMERGYVPDAAHQGNPHIPNWNRGEPSKHWWHGLKSSEPGVTLPLAAFRCTGCGFVEFYADETFAAH